MAGRVRGTVLRPWVRRLGRAPVAVWALTALFTLVLAGWALLAPVGRAPDEPSHVDLVLLLASGDGYPDFDDRDTGRALVAVGLAHTPREGTRLTPEAAPPRSERRTFDEWGGAEPAGGWPNQLTQHPPTYYATLAVALRAERALWPGSDPAPLDREWLVLRLANVALLAPLPALAWAAARRLGAGGAAAASAAAVPLAIPQLTHLGAAVNNDNLLLLASALAAVGVAGVLGGDRRAATALATGAATGLAVATKAFGLVLVPWVVLAYVVRARRDGLGWRWCARRLAVAAGPVVLLGGAWPARNLWRHGEPFPNISDAVYTRRVPGFEVDPLTYVREYVPSTLHGFWGDLGWLDTPIAPLAATAATLVAGAALVVALAPGRRAPGLVPRRRLAALLALAPLLAATLVAMDLQRYRFGGAHAFMQGRYLFAAVPVLAVGVGVGAARALGRWAPPVVTVAALGLQAEAVRVVLRSWWAEPGASLRRSAAAARAWAPVPEPVTWALAVALLAAAVAVLVAQVRAARGGGVGTGAAPVPVPDAA